MTRGAFSTFLAFLLCAAAAAPATAATTIGYVGPGAPHTGEGGAIGFSPGLAYAVPTGGGVITSWTVNGGTRPASTLPLTALKLFRVGTEPATGKLTATVIASSRLMYVPDGVSAFRTRIPVSGGEQLGVFFPEPGPLFTSGPESTACGARGGGKLGETFTQDQTMTCESSRAVNIEARIEPDVDEDGFGDETQDGCLGIRGRAAGCHGRYRGRGQGHPFELRFGYRDGGIQPYAEWPGRVVEDMRIRVTLRCPDGYGEELTVYGGIAKAMPVYVKPSGAFAFARGMTPGNGIVGGRTEISGRLTGSRARGTASVALRYRHHGICESGRYPWRIRSR